MPLLGNFATPTQQRPFVNDQPYNGGVLKIVPATAANGNLIVPHALRAIPRWALVLDIGTGSFPGVVPRGTTAWSQTAVSWNWPGNTQPVVLWLTT